VRGEEETHRWQRRHRWGREVERRRRTRNQNSTAINIMSRNRRGNSQRPVYEVISNCESFPAPPSLKGFEIQRGAFTNRGGSRTQNQGTFTHRNWNPSDFQPNYSTNVQLPSFTREHSTSPYQRRGGSSMRGRSRGGNIGRRGIYRQNSAPRENLVQVPKQELNLRPQIPQQRVSSTVKSNLTPNIERYVITMGGIKLYY
jgi:hypothetical protein